VGRSPAKLNGSEKWTAKEVADALRKHKGIRAAAAQELECSYATVQNYEKRYKIVRDAKNEAREQFKDRLEYKWMQLVEDDEAYGHWDAVKFGLTRYARDRGYGDKTEVTGPNDEPIQVQHTVVSQPSQQLISDVIELRRKRAIEEEQQRAIEAAEDAHP